MASSLLCEESPVTTRVKKRQGFAEHFLYPKQLSCREQGVSLQQDMEQILHTINAQLAQQIDKTSVRECVNLGTMDWGRDSAEKEYAYEVETNGACNGKIIRVTITYKLCLRGLSGSTSHRLRLYY